MPKDKKEWEPIMKFWSEVLKRRNAWELNSDIVEITQGQSQVKVPTATNDTPISNTSQDTGDNLPSKKPITGHVAQGKVPVTGTGGLKRGFLSKGL
jgi:hypothetical protein